MVVTEAGDGGGDGRSHRDKGGIGGDGRCEGSGDDVDEVVVEVEGWWSW